MADISHHQFVALLKKSKVVEPKKLQAWLTKTKKIESARKLAKSLVQEELLTTWQAKFLLSGRHRLRIGNYFLLSRLRRDELGARYLAIHASLKRKVELQIFSRDLTSDTQRWKDMIQKASLVAKLDHPALVHVYDIDHDDDRYFLVVEHVSGRPLDVQKEIFTTPQVGKLVLQCAEGIEVAHQNKVVHGTIDQTDILLTDKGTVKLQNLTVSPMRNSNSDSPEAEPIDDYIALATLGEKILQANPGATGGSGVGLSAVFELMKSNGPSAIKKLKEWVEATPDAAAEKVEVTNSGANLIFSPTLGSSSGVDLGKTNNSSIDVAARDESADNSSTSIVEAAKSSRPFLIATAIGAAMFLGIMIFGAVRGYEKFVAKPKRQATAAAEEKSDLEAKKRAAYSAKEQRAFDRRQAKNKPAGKDAKQSAGPKNRKGEPAEKNPKGQPNKNKRNQGRKQKRNRNQNKAMDAEVKSQADQPKNNDANLVQTESTTPEEAKPEEAKAEDVAKTEDSAADLFNNFFGSTTTQTSADPDKKTAGSGNANGIPPIVTDPDDLKKLKNIGPATAKVLGDAGIKTYDQIVQMTPAQLDKVLKEGGTNQLGDKWKDVIEEAKPLAEVSRSKAADHFRKVDRVFELPAIDSTKPKQLAKLEIPSTYSLSTELISPEGISPRPIFFELDRQSSAGVQTWTVSSKKNKTSSRSNPVATFTDSQGVLSFAWLPEAAKDKTAVYLRNCLMRLSTPDGKSSVSKLRMPIKVRPLRITEDNLSDTLKLEIEGAPDFAKMKIQLGGFSNRAIEAIDPVIGFDSPAVVALRSRGDKGGFLNLQVSAARTGKTIKLSADLIFQGSPVASKDQLMAMEGQLRKMAGIATQRSNSDPKNRGLQKEQRAAEGTHSRMKDYLESIKWFLDGNGGIGEPINFDVSIDFGDAQIVLAKSDKNMVDNDKKKKKKK